MIPKKYGKLILMTAEEKKMEWINSEMNGVTNHLIDKYNSLSFIIYRLYK